jgi:hypothetical protein
MLATPPPGARKVRFNYPKIVKGEILISVYWKDAKGTHTEYMPLWSLQRDYASELHQLKADLQARLKSLPGLASQLQPILDLWNSGGGMPVGEEIAELDDDDDADLQALVHGVSAPSDKSSSGGATVNGVGASSGGATVNGVGASSGGMTVYGYPSPGSGWSDSAEDNGAGVGIGAEKNTYHKPDTRRVSCYIERH